MKQLLKSTLLLLFACSAISMKAQQTNNAASHKAIINGNSYEYSIGEMAIISTSNMPNLIVTQGYLQPYKSISNSSNATSTNALDALSKNITVFPNPTQNILYVETNQSSNRTLNYELFDTKGAIIRFGTWQQTNGYNKFNLNVEALTPGSYFLVLSSENAELKKDVITFRIQKVN